MTAPQIDQITQIRNIIQNSTYGPGISASYRETAKGLTYTVVVRDGATPDMIIETKRHYVRAALQAAQANSDFSEPDKTQYSQRTEYAFHWSHSQPRVQVWGNVPVAILKNDAVHTLTVAVNIMTEITNAVDLLAHLRMVADSMYIPDEKPTLDMRRDEDSQLNIVEHPQQATSDTSPAPTANTSGFTPQIYSQTGTPHFADFPRSKEQKLAFAQQYASQVVSFTMRRIHREWTGNPPVAECGFYADPNGYTDQYPAFRATVNQYVRDEATREYLSHLPSDTMTGEWRAVVYVALKGDKVYFNLNKIEVVTDDAYNDIVQEEDTPF
jgi:hypothetical protein